ncbi:MAG: GNAT family N-acetyltransferase [Erysipelotrichia bacterium]|nr:GNAT family N-acetyltransferase [Erysipelotrichia bacterium]NCC55763.1 GNAT family N-acetyltransferase [Erysipelotrichia bacterium]
MNKNLAYHEIIMRCPMIYQIHVNDLPSGYRFKAYTLGDEKHWAALEYEVNEFSSKADALAYFERVFAPHQEQLKKRMFFILDAQGNYVATASAWFKDDEKRHYALLHWVSVSPTQQGKGLGKIIVSYALSHFAKVDPNEKEIFLHTQTWSYKAIALYYQLGFRITQTPLIHSHTDMRCMEVLKEVLPKELIDNLVEK